MISQITQIAKIETLLSELKTVRFNSVLPVSIDVIKRSAKNEYLLQIGTREIVTNSKKELDVGDRYWGIMREDRDVGLTLSKLLKKPKLLQGKMANILPTFSNEKLVELITKENPKIELKTLLFESLSKTTSKSEFMTITNMILALNENIMTLVLKNENQNTMFQFKKREKKSRTKDSDSIEIDFYAGFEHLGPIEGIVSIVDDEKSVLLKVYYQESLDFLQNELKFLGFEGVIYKRDGQIKPLYEFASSLLDLRG